MSTREGECDCLADLRGLGEGADGGGGEGLRLQLARAPHCVLLRALELGRIQLRGHTACARIPVCAPCMQQCRGARRQLFSSQPKQSKLRVSCKQTGASVSDAQMIDA